MEEGPSWRDKWKNPWKIKFMENTKESFGCGENVHITNLNSLYTFFSTYSLKQSFHVALRWRICYRRKNFPQLFRPQIGTIWMFMLENFEDVPITSACFECSCWKNSKCAKCVNCFSTICMLMLEKFKNVQIVFIA